jgi:hypothetical protein
VGRERRRSLVDTVRLAGGGLVGCSGLAHAFQKERACSLRASHARAPCERVRGRLVRAQLEQRREGRQVGLVRVRKDTEPGRIAVGVAHADQPLVIRRGRDKHAELERRARHGRRSRCCCCCSVDICNRHRRVRTSGSSPSVLGCCLGCLGRHGRVDRRRLSLVDRQHVRGQATKEGSAD